MRGRCSTRVFAVLLVATGWGSPGWSAAAPTDAPYTPPMFSYGDGRIALIEAVRLTLANDPNLLLKKQDVRQQSGVAQELRGAFDAVLNGNLKYSFKEQQVRASRIKSERDKRDQASQTRDDACDSVNTNQQTLTELQQAQGSEPGSISVPSDPSLDTQLKFLDSLINSAPTFAEKQALLNTRLDFLNAEIAQQQRNIADAQFACGLAGDALTRLGGIPEFEQTAHGEFSLRLDKLLRSGISVAPYINAQYDHDQFRGKHNGFSQPLVDEFGNVVKGELGTPVQQFVDFGGTNIEDLYKITLGFEVNLPLLRGRGAASVAAPERAAERDLEGASLLLKHRASESVLASVTAYWNLLAARQRVDVLRRSVDLQEQLVKITDQLINGDEVPKSERSRALAGQATSQAQLQAGEGDLVSARMALAQAMGLAVESERNAPLADGPFPPSPDSAQLAALDATQLARAASTRRFDLRAAEAGVDSRVLLAEAARLNARSKLDFKGSAFGTSIGETHLNEAFKDPSRPGASLQLTYEKPFGNNTLLGRKEQADAQLRQKEIAATDLDRTVKIAVVQGLETLIQAVDRLKHAEVAGQYSQETIDGEVEKLKAGESTLVDTILSEQQRTSALLDLISARQQVAVLLAQLRFQTGTMVHEVADGNTQVSPEDLTTLPTAQAAAPGGGTR